MEPDDTVEMPAVNDGGGTASTLVYDRMFLGELDEIPRIRAGLQDWLNDRPVRDDVVLIASELAANAILHSASKALYFTVRAYLHPDHVRVEVEDLGGPWRCRPVDGHPHGLDLVTLLAEDWGTEVRTCDGMRTTWARVPIKTPNESDVAARGPGAQMDRG